MEFVKFGGFAFQMKWIRCRRPQTSIQFDWNFINQLIGLAFGQEFWKIVWQVEFLVNFPAAN